MRIPRPHSTAGAVVELAIIVALAIAVAIGVQAFLVKPFQIPSGSMIPTLEINQRVLVNRFIYRIGEPEIGDIAVFHPPAGASSQRCGTVRRANQACPQPAGHKLEEHFIKRIVAGPGDRLRVEDGRPVVNGELASEDFAAPCGSQPICTLSEEITIPDGHFFMMGDNRGASDDSRYWGPVPEDWIIGKAFATYWPPSRIGIL